VVGCRSTGGLGSINDHKKTFNKNIPAPSPHRKRPLDSRRPFSSKPCRSRLARCARAPCDIPFSIFTALFGKSSEVPAKAIPRSFFCDRPWANFGRPRPAGRRATFWWTDQAGNGATRPYKTPEELPAAPVSANRAFEQNLSPRHSAVGVQARSRLHPDDRNVGGARSILALLTLRPPAGHKELSRRFALKITRRCSRR